MNSVIHPSLNSDVDEVANVGALLRAARLRRGDNLRQVSNVLKIRYDYLESIEDIISFLLKLTLTDLWEMNNILFSKSLRCENLSPKLICLI